MRLPLIVFSCMFVVTFPSPHFLPKPTDQLLAAADCLRPKHIAKIDATEECKNKIQESESEQKAEEIVTIIQYKDYFDGIGQSCEIKKSTFSFQCWQGAFVVEQRWERVPEISVANEVSKEECRRLHETLNYKDENGRKYPIKDNSVNHIQYSSVGAVWSNDMNAYCDGTKSLDHGEIHNDLVVMNSVEITLRSNIKMRFSKDGKSSVNMDKGTQLECHMKSNGCEQKTVTYLWNPIDENCNFIEVKKAKGRFTQKQNFISMDENLFLKIKSESTECGMKMLKTNIPGISLVKEPNMNNRIMKSSGEDDVNLVDFIIARDDYVAYLARYNLAQANKKHQTALCQYIAKTTEADIFISQDSGLVFPTGEATFVRAKGDVLDEFKCIPVTVTPRDTSTCSRELPVSYNGTDMYLIPGTRILTQSKTLVPCAKAGAAEFKTLNNFLVASTPKIIFTSQPNKRSLWTDPEMDENNPEQTLLKDEKYSLYTEEEIRQYSHHLNFPRQIQELTSTLSVQRCMNGQSCGEFASAGGNTPFIHTSDLGMLENMDIMAIAKNFFYRGIINNFVFLYDWSLRIVVGIHFVLWILKTMFKFDAVQVWRNRRQTAPLPQPQSQFQSQNMDVSAYNPSAPIEPV